MLTGVINQYLKEFIMLKKIYQNDHKFGGMGDNFNSKVTIFLNKCRQVSLLVDGYIYGVSIMLSDQV